MPKTLYGLSLSRCVLDLVSGAQKMDDVILIVSSIQAKTGREFAGVVAQYQKTVWKRCVNKAGAIALELWNAEMINQPMLTDGQHPVIKDGAPIWVTDWDAIEWSVAKEFAPKPTDGGIPLANEDTPPETVPSPAYPPENLDPPSLDGNIIELADEQATPDANAA